MKSPSSLCFAWIPAVLMLAGAPVARAQMGISSVEPSSAPAGSQTTITVYGGADCAWSYLSSTVSFSPATTITTGDIELLDYNVLSTPIDIPANAVVGLQTVTVDTNGRQCIGVGVFEVTCDGCQQASLLSVQPAAGNAGQTIEVTIHGQGTHFDATSQVTVSGQGVTASDEVALDATELTASLVIDAGASIGLRDLTVTTGVEQATGPGLFEVLCSGCVQPHLVSVTPDTGSPGNNLSVTVVGDGTHFDGSSVLSFTGSGIQVNTLTPQSQTALTASLSIALDAPISARTVMVTTGAEQVSGADLFRVAEQPLLVTPDSGIQGQTLASVTLEGGPGGYSQVSGVDLGPGIAIPAFQAPDDTRLVLTNLTIALDAPVGRRDLTLSLPSGPRTVAQVFSVLQGPATQLLSIDPDHADRGHPGLAVGLVGQNTHFDASDVAIDFSGGGVMGALEHATDGGHMTARVVIAESTTEDARDVSVQVGADCDADPPAPCEQVALPGAFLVTPPGRLDAAAPAVVQAGEQPTITIDATDGQFEQGRTVLVFDPPDGLAVQGLTVVNPDQLQVQLAVSPQASGVVRDVKAVTGPEVALGPGLLDVNNPQILTVAPASGYQSLTSLPVLIIGVDIPFAADTQVTFSGSGITLIETTYDPTAPDQIAVRIAIAADAPIGRRDLTVQAGGLEVTAQGVFLVMELPAPSGQGCACGQPASGAGWAWFGLFALAFGFGGRLRRRR